MKIKTINLDEYVTLDTKEKRNTIVLKDLNSTVDIEDNRTASFIITTSTPDTDKDIIVPEGIDFTHYQKNPVVLWQHNRDQLPIGKCVGLTRTGKGWKAEVQFPPEGVYSFADDVYQMVKAGYLNAVSIGFIPTDVDPNRLKGYTINECSLFEFSIVTVPANPECLIVNDTSKSLTDNDFRTEKEITSEDIPEKINIEVWKKKKLFELYKYNYI